VKTAVKVVVPPPVEAQKASVRAVLIPDGNLVRREVAQFALSLLLQIEESFPAFFEQVPFEAQLTLIETLNSWKKEEFVKRAKALTVWGFARLWHQDLPDVPNPAECRNLGFKGSAARWIRNLFVCKRNPKNVRFFWSLLQGVKRGCAPINEEFLEEAYEKHKKSLTKPLNTEFDDLEAFRFGRRLFKGVSEVRENELPAPSFSASFRSTRSEGGKLAELRKCHAVSRDDEQSAPSLADVGLTYQRGELRRVEGISLKRSEALQHYLTTDRKRTRVQMVLEPLKARPITAGSAAGSWVALKGQRETWQHLRKLPQCALIGEPLSESHLEWLENVSPEEFDHWVSGDYSAATDNLDIRLTKRLFEAYLYWATTSDEEDLVYREMLYEQFLHYPDGSVVTQTNGQLMGSPLSFPILCAANLYGYHRAYVRYFGKTVPISKLPVLVNGDDILFKASPAFYRIWQEEVKRIGFELSVGKSYFSKEFLTVNSKLYLVKGKATKLKQSEDSSTGSVNKCDVKFQLVSFFHPALVLPANYLQKEDDSNQGEADPLVGRLSEALARSTSPRQSFERFKYFNSTYVRQATRNGLLNLFLHPNLGGLGAEPGPLKFSVTRFQRRLATHLFRNRLTPAVSLTSSVVNKGLIPLECSKSAVVATVPPAPERDVPNQNVEIHRSGSRFWRFRVPHLPPASQKSLISFRQLRALRPVLEVTPCEENSDRLIDQEFARCLGLTFCTVQGSVASLKVTT